MELDNNEKLGMVSVESEDNIYVKVSDLVKIDRVPEVVKDLINRYTGDIKKLGNGLPVSGFLGKHGVKITGIFKYGELGFISYVGDDETLVTDELIHIFSNISEDDYDLIKARADKEIEQLKEESNDSGTEEPS